MAYDKIIPIRTRLDHCMGYVLNPEKTELAAVLTCMENGEKTSLPAQSSFGKGYTLADTYDVTQAFTPGGTASRT